MEELTLVIVEDDDRTVKSFTECSKNYDDILILKCCKGAQEATQCIIKNSPDVVLLDLELSNGDGSGIDVLKSLQNSSLSKKPFIVVTSDYINAPIRRRIQSLGADFIFWKKQDGYSESYVIDFVRDMASSIHGSEGQNTYQSIESVADRKSMLTDIIKNELLSIGITPRMKGFNYLAEAILLFIETPQLNLAAAVAQNNKTTKISVTRAMEYAIDKAWNTMDADVINANFRARVRSDTGVPSVLEFIYYYADKAKRSL